MIDHGVSAGSVTPSDAKTPERTDRVPAVKCGVSYSGEESQSDSRNPERGIRDIQGMRLNYLCPD